MVFMGASRNGHYINSLSSSAVALTPSLVSLEHPAAIQLTLSLSQSVTSLKSSWRKVVIIHLMMVMFATMVMHWPPAKIMTVEDGRVTIHPGSVNCDSTHEFQSPWLCYHGKVKTSSLFQYDCSEVSPPALLFFGGSAGVSISKIRGIARVRVAPGIEFDCDSPTSEVLENLRTRWDDYLSYRVSSGIYWLVGNKITWFQFTPGSYSALLISHYSQKQYRGILFLDRVLNLKMK